MSDDADLRATGEPDLLGIRNQLILRLTKERDAALAGERAAREALARVEALIDQPAPDGWVRYRVLVSDLRAALSPTPPDTAEQEPQR